MDTMVSGPTLRTEVRADLHVGSGKLLASDMGGASSFVGQGRRRGLELGGDPLFMARRSGGFFHFLTHSRAFLSKGVAVGVILILVRLQV